MRLCREASWLLLLLYTLDGSNGQCQYYIVSISCMLHTWRVSPYQTLCQHTCWQGSADQGGSPDGSSWCSVPAGVWRRWRGRCDTPPGPDGGRWHEYMTNSGNNMTVRIQNAIGSNSFYFSLSPFDLPTPWLLCILSSAHTLKWMSALTGVTNLHPQNDHSWFH